MAAYEINLKRKLIFILFSQFNFNHVGRIYSPLFFIPFNTKMHI